MNRYVEQLSEDRLCIFLFHGVIQRNDTVIRNYNRKHIEAEYFDSVICDLKTCGTPLSIDEIIYHHESQEPFPRNSFVVSFDDGFENNLSVAAPILMDHEIPAVFYLTTGFIEHNAMSWIDRIEYCFEEVAEFSLHLPWRSDLVPVIGAEDKRIILDEIRAQTKSNPHIAADALVDNLSAQIGIEPPSESDHPLDKKLSWDQVRTLGANDLFTLGGHTHSHPILSFLTETELHDEISTSLTFLDEITSVKTRHFSYPEGLEHCYSASVIEALQQYGVACCPTAIEGKNALSTDLFELRRISVT